jgi:hypothetical protein
MTPFEQAILPSEYEKVSEHLRLGQFYVNTFSRLYPDTCIPPEVDCFSLNTLIPDFLVFVAGHEHNPQKDQSL